MSVPHDNLPGTVTGLRNNRIEYYISYTIGSIGNYFTAQLLSRLREVLKEFGSELALTAIDTLSCCDTVVQP